MRPRARGAFLAEPTQSGQDHLTEAAVLYYHTTEDDRLTGATRVMTSVEAQSQINVGQRSVSKLPKDFWQHIRMMQVPILSMQGTHHITYNFNLRTPNEPQTPLPKTHRRSTSDANLAPMLDGGNTRVAKVPREINRLLSERRKGELGAGYELVSGVFEFVHDEADGALWLVNASRLTVRMVAEVVDEEVEKGPTEELRYFREAEFALHLQEQECNFKDMKQKFGKDDADSPGNSVRRLAGQRKMPEELTAYYDAAQEMHRIYEDEIRHHGRALGGNICQVLGKSYGAFADVRGWFRRWVRAHRRSLDSGARAVAHSAAAREPLLRPATPAEREPAARPRSAARGRPQSATTLGERLRGPASRSFQGNSSETLSEPGPSRHSLL